jgi:hypothetical protein
MKFFKIILFIFFCSQCASCATTGNIENNQANPLFFYVKQEFIRPPGEQYKITRAVTQRVTFVIENKSNDFIIVRNINILGQLPDPNRWYGSSYGSTRYQPIEDAWVYNQLEQVLSSPVFASGVIAPGADFAIERWVMFKESYLDTEITFQRLSKLEAAKHIYFYQHSGEFSQKRKFRRLDNPVVAKDDLDWSLVIFPKAEDFKLYTQNIRCKVDLKEPEFSLDEARKKAGCVAGDFIFSKQLNSWLIKCRNGIFLVNKKKKIQLSDIDLLSMAVLESQNKIGVILPLSGYEKFKPKSPRIEGPGYFNPGITEIPKEKMIELLEYARNKHDKVKVLQYDPDGLGKNAYIIIGEFDEHKRRAIAMEGILE